MEMSIISRAGFRTDIYPLRAAIGEQIEVRFCLSVVTAGKPALTFYDVFNYLSCSAL